ACAHKPAPRPAGAANQKSVLLIHGSHFDESAWQKVIPELSKLYHTTAITLPGRQEQQHVSLKNMATDVCGKTNNPTIVVAHSFGGVVANAMVGVCPEKIRQIVYVTGLVPLKGEKPFDAVNKSDQKTYNEIAEFKKDRIYPKPAETFLPGMDQGIDMKKAPTLTLHSESYSAGKAPLKYDEVVFDKIPKAYVYTEKDRIVTMETQIKFTSRTPMTKTASVNSGHLPMLSQPKALVSALKQVIP
ncbi:MAG: alpha/beta fold hydrolase, partial [Bdellovibrionales bacterium]